MRLGGETSQCNVNAQGLSSDGIFITVPFCPESRASFEMCGPENSYPPQGRLNSYHSLKSRRSTGSFPDQQLVIKGAYHLAKKSRNFA